MLGVDIGSVGGTALLSADRRPMTAAEIFAFNTGVEAMLAIAARSAEALARDPRHIPVSFAQAALAELAESGRALLLEEPGASFLAPTPDPARSSPVPAGVAAQ